MITINGVEILTVGDGITWSGDKDIVSRTLNFTFLYAPEDKNYPRYQAKIGDRVEWIEENTTRFIGYIEKVDYSTDGEKINISCIDLMVRLLKSKCVGRFRGTLNDICNKICGLFGIKNGVNVSNTHNHNIVSEGDLTYYDVLDTACKSLFSRYCLYLDGTTLKLATTDIINTFEIGKNIRSSRFAQDLSNLVTKVLIIDNEGKLLDSVQNDRDLKQFGLFQEVYNYNKEKNNITEAKKLLKSVENTATLVCNNDNNCISGSFIKVIEPINNFIGTFEVTSDTHTIGVDSVMTLEVTYVSN